MRRGLLIVAVVVAVGVLVLLAGGFFKTEIEKRSLVGTYYVYRVTGAFISEGTARIEVLDENETHYKVAEYLYVSTFLGSHTEQNITWEPKEKAFTEDAVYIGEGTIYLEKYGTRHVEVYVEKDLKENETTTYYVDPETKIPLMIVFETPFISSNMTITLELIETNNPQLQR